MPHEHDESCGHEAHDDDHEHDNSNAGPSDNLFMRIDRSNVTALNSNGQGPEVIKPWHERLDETKVPLAFPLCNFYLVWFLQSLESDADDQL
jgi:hypothetical protein